MSNQRKTTFAERQQFVEMHQQGSTYQAIGEACGWKESTVKKHCLTYQHHSETALQPRKAGPVCRGILSTFEGVVRFAILRVKKQHPEWGAVVVLDEVAQRASVKGLPLPKPAQTAAYFQQFGSRLVSHKRNLRLPPSVTPLSEGETALVFQLDMQERLQVESLGYFNVLQIRAPQWGMTVGCYPHQAGEKRWQRKVSQVEARDDCRTTFEQWGLPDILQTDKDKVLTPSDETPFPTDFTLWLVGLGIQHKLIQRVTQNASVERAHRTFDKQVLSGVPSDTWSDFLHHVKQEQIRLRERIPSRAKACHGQIPIQAHPEAHTPKRPYRCDWESQLFDMQKVFHYLAGGKWLRSASAKGQFHFADQIYSVGTAHASQFIIITFDLQTKQFAAHSQTGVFIKHLPATWLTETRIRSLPEYENVNVQSDT